MLSSLFHRAARTTVPSDYLKSTDPRNTLISRTRRVRYARACDDGTRVSTSSCGFNPKQILAGTSRLLLAAGTVEITMKGLLGIEDSLL